MEAPPSIWACFRLGGRGIPGCRFSLFPARGLPGTVRPSTGVVPQKNQEREGRFFMVGG